MRLEILHFLYGAGTIMIGYYAGKIVERKDTYNSLFKKWANEIGHFSPVCPSCQKLDISRMTWRCMCCEQMRPDACISVKTHDVGLEHGYEHADHMKINVKYCNDNSECYEKAFSKLEWIEWPKCNEKEKTILAR